jgi:hypothetical protein
MKSRVSSVLLFAGTTLLSLCAFGAPLAACSSDDPAPVAPQPVVPPVPPAPQKDAPDAAPPVDAAPPKVLPKPAFPEVQSRGGTVIKAPKVVAIVFSGDPLASQVTDFTSKIASSAYWHDLGVEYGVGAITALDTITVNEAAPATITSAAIETWLTSKLTGATPEFGVPDASTLYAVYYPNTTTITMDGFAGAQGQSCMGYGGYHFEINVAGTNVGYAVLPRCSDIDELTVAASHEYFEWATDPFPQTQPAYAKLDDAHWAWQAAFIGELGDLCTYLDRDYLRPTEIGFQVQTMWSNKASLAGKFPCAPKANVTYLQGIPTTEDSAVVPSQVQGQPDITTKAIRVKPGQSRTVDVLVYADQPHADLVPFRALTFDEFTTGMANGPNATGYKYSVAPSYANVGDAISVTIKAPVTTSYDLLVMVAYTSDTSVDYWPVLVVNDAGPKPPPGKPMAIPSLPAGLGRLLARHRSTPRFTKLGMKRSALPAALQGPPAVQAR